MIASERLAYAIGTAGFSSPRHKLARLIRKAAAGRLASLAGAEGGRPPFAFAALLSSLLRTRVENSHGTPRPAPLCASGQVRGRISAKVEAANRIGWAGARGTGWNSIAPGTPHSSAGGALARIGGGAGA